MSMLTPPGMGGKKYRITGDRYPRMRRPRHRRRIALATAAGACALGLVGWGTLQLIDVFGGTSGKAQAAEKGTDAKRKCKPAAAVAPPPAPSAITVNVLNATPRGGLAKQTADELKKRGFDIGKVGNAPAAYDKKVKNNGVLLGPSGAAGSLKVLATQLPGTRQETDGRKDHSVDLIIGDTFQELTKAKDARKALTALARPPRPTAPAC
ncbi:LytR C-terminal domain-containing protein [Streptomyces sp. BBFR2]|uniref:LytR C-terminal domain-containing protein n=1 Tax=Streptomyces sp. BBFR2 TaxID=3372854 RepID=UPI0037DA7058